ncbi:MAG: LacI family transcriptional regulator [Actinomycetota bacterium]|nr:LacI family transcriptional regulator [Actinomycetota bacterium]
MAERANVSKSLVSPVMPGSSSVSEALREAVLKAAELDYRPNELARGLAQRRTHTVGVLLSYLRNPSFAEIVNGIEVETGPVRYRTLLGTGDRDPEHECQAICTLLERQTDGMILPSPSISAKDLDDAASSTPTVLVGRRTLDCAVSDDFAGAVMAVEHLFELGHRRIAHVSGGGSAGAAARQRGYERAMMRLGLERHLFIARGEYTEKGGYEGARRLLGEKVGPTAVFVANDLAALGALTAMRKAGLSVPEGVSVISYDNTYLAALSSIALTSVEQPRHEMGVLAARLLLQRIESGHIESEHPAGRAAWLAADLCGRGELDRQDGHVGLQEQLLGDAAQSTALPTGVCRLAPMTSRSTAP